jgi:hypothetical protein
MQVQVGSKDEKHTTSQFSFDYNDENVTGHSSHSSPERGSGEITRVVTGSDSSPIRRFVSKTICNGNLLYLKCFIVN